jgi:hypothetical protein
MGWLLFSFVLSLLGLGVFMTVMMLWAWMISRAVRVWRKQDYIFLLGVGV